MCGLCGLIGEKQDWTASLSTLPKRQERHKRLKFINQLTAPYRIKVSDVHGVDYLVQTMTGKQAIANGLPNLWQQIKQLTGKGIDVLDDEFLDKFQ